MNRVNAILIGIFTLVICALVPSANAQEGEVTAPETRLQTEIEPVGAEMDWRAEVGIVERDNQEPASFPAVLAWIIANITMLVFLGLALVVVVLIVLLLIKHGGGGGLRLSAEADVGRRAGGEGAGATALVDAPSLTLDEILQLDDLELALGALLRLVLEAAISLSGHVLRRSATAREILRRLPSDFAHLSAVATLVREAERVRYGGASMTRERFDELVADIRPLLAQERAS